MFERYALLASGAALWLCAGCGSPSNPNWIGVNTGAGQAARTAATQPAVRSDENLSQTMEYVSELKTPLVRDYVMNWGLMQPRLDDRIDFGPSDAFMRAAGKIDADVLVVFDGIPAWASIDPAAVGTEPGLPPRQYAEAFIAFVQKYVERYDGDGSRDMAGLKRGVHAYQFMSEMEDVPTAEYAYWLKLFYQAVKRADPKSSVVLGALRSPGVRAFDLPGNEYPRYFEYLLAEQELQGPAYPYFDVAAFDSFPARYPGRTPFDDALAYVRQTMADHQLSLPVWLTAFGCSVNNKTPAQQADSLVKWTVKARAIGIERVYWDALRDAPPGGPAAVANSGLLAQTDKGLAPRPAFTALTKLVQEIRERPRVAMRSEGLYVLTGHGDPHYVIWKEETYDPSRMLIPGWWSVETLSGPKVVRQGSEMTLTSSPLFIERTSSPFINK